MKKKAIEKIPYLTLPETSSRGVKYIAVTAFKAISNEKHLLVEIYRNKKKEKAIPVVRIALTKKDFGNYFPGKDTWTRDKVKREAGYSRINMMWDIERANRANTWDQFLKENILMSEADFDRIKEMCNVNIWNKDRWPEYIQKHEENIAAIKRVQAKERKYERRQQALEERIENTPKLPKKMILNRADRIYFSRKHFLYYKKNGCWADITCSKCGGVSHGRWKEGISYESQFQKWVEDPREGQSGHCPMCGEVGEYKCQGKVKDEHSKSTYLFLGQKYKDNGFVMRYIKVSKTWHLQLKCGEKGLEMNGAYEKLYGVEIARAYYMPGKKVQIDYHKHNPYTGSDFWDDCNLAGLGNIAIGEGMVLPETYEAMEGTMFRYSAMKEYGQTTHNRYNPIEYLSRYKETPQIEMLVKIGLTGVVTSMLKAMPKRAAPTKTRQELVLWIKRLIAEGRLDEFYTSWQWRKLSRQVRKMDHNECQICKAKGRYRKADSAHHQMEVKKYPELALSIWYMDKDGEIKRNIIAICESCHAEVHDRYQRWQQGKRYHEQGHTNEEWW